jgi:hypothetical protein
VAGHFWSADAARHAGPSPALVVAVVALVIALGGISYAAFVLPKNSVGTRQLRNKAVTPAKIAPRTIALSANGTALSAQNGSNAVTIPTSENAGDIRRRRRSPQCCRDPREHVQQRRRDGLQ